jgi:hypothetical protein
VAIVAALLERGHRDETMPLVLFSTTTAWP